MKELRKHMTAGLRLLLVATVALVMTAGCGKGEKTAGANAPENISGFTSWNSFTAKTADGNEFTESNFSDHDVTVINVWSITCGPCIREMPAIAEFQKNLDDNVQLITYCIDGNHYPDEAKRILSDSGFEGITLLSGDGDMETFTEEIQYVPTTIFVDNKGNIVGEAIIGAYQDLERRYQKSIDDALKTLGK
ncbi:MAG: redoxin family protein [Lachnospiraceae bacterium]|nr:redoxin family protein [Lachnospiraceae bacterium]